MSRDGGGLESILMEQLSQKSKDDLAEELKALYRLAGKNMIARHNAQEELETKNTYIRNRNAAGAIAKSQKFQPMKDKVSQIYKSLRAAKQGKNPSFKTLSREVEEIYSEEELSLNTLRDWHKKLNKGETL